MKLLTFVDLHGDTSLLKQLIKKAKQPDIDLVINAGDFTNFENKLKTILQKLNDLNKPILTIPGNHESAENIKKASKNLKNIKLIHKKSFTFKDTLIIGYGEGGFSEQDSNFRKFVRKYRNKVKGKRVILVFHGPPYKTKLDKVNGNHVGNKDYKKAIERLKPELVICGHLHENADKIDQLNKTNLVNPGWEGMIIEF